MQASSDRRSAAQLAATGPSWSSAATTTSSARRRTVASSPLSFMACRAHQERLPASPAGTPVNRRRRTWRHASWMGAGRCSTKPNRLITCAATKGETRSPCASSHFVKVAAWPSSRAASASITAAACRVSREAAASAPRRPASRCASPARCASRWRHARPTARRVRPGSCASARSSLTSGRRGADRPAARDAARSRRPARRRRRGSSFSKSMVSSAWTSAGSAADDGLRQAPRFRPIAAVERLADLPVQPGQPRRAGRGGPAGVIAVAGCQRW